MNPKVTVIIVNYNTKDILRDCLANLQNSYSPLEIIVVDNMSKDGSSDMVNAEFPNVNLVALEYNKGLAHASNIGLNHASGDYILYLGSDAFPEKNVISGLVNYFEANKEVGLATCKLVLRNGDLDMDAHRGFPTPWTAFTHMSKLDKLFKRSKLFDSYFLGYKDLNSPHEIDLCISHFMFIRKQVFGSVGKWDEDYFVFGEDVDICYRIKQKGWKIMYLPQFKAIHYKGSSIGIREESRDITKASAETKRKLTNSTTDAMEMFYRKHYTKKYPTLVTQFILMAIKLLKVIRNFKY